ncbi:MAG TPA: TlpA disulfide reductase family protein [Saprospiraceae bacterium]|nr:TlpA family protein disulfide reductase [Saprospiraceae bacterium]HND96510.1 TlpA disulfide reductase family protein [Chitinophagaceae bacterium]MCC6688058.1 TlpA family protein disulfide reductase [Saprospiraceae bacterium]HMV23611.1 TlpA disulfide reductase family protein [Saprospiraceae bacterium]HMX82083.1 TlpA disulfide reductase family protein [Saprospiraceae bacterium]
MKKNLLLFLSLIFFGSMFAQNALPNIDIKNLEGKTIKIKDAVEPGKVTILGFWATWCSPCKKELDAIGENWDEWKEKYNCELLAITVDDQRSLGKVKPMVKEKGWTFPVYSDANQQLLKGLSGQSVPFTVVLDKAGNIAFIHNGYTPGDETELEAKIAELSAK